MTKSNHPVQLWISDLQTVHTKIITHLQSIFCAHHGCLECTTCHQITKKEHPSIIWFTPERSYTVEQIDDIIHATSFQLNDFEKFCIIIDQAERLTEQAANKLLKTIEEPLPGYLFFFLTNRQQALLTTIQSRCVIVKFKSISTLEKFYDFLEPFTQLNFNDPIGFIKKIESLDIKEQETKEIIDDLFEHWTKKTKDEIVKNGSVSQRNHRIISIIQDGIINPPMPGGAKIFWKNIYLKMHYATTYESAV